MSKKKQLKQIFTKKRLVIIAISLLLFSSILIALFTQKSYSLSNSLYNKVEEDIVTNGYGSTYTGDHADTYDGTVGNKDIYYYSQAGHNNIHFADFCWQIVRTTDTGGVKLVYNGRYDSSTKCNNSGAARLLDDKKAFNSTNTYRSNVGYVYDAGVDSTIKEYIDSWYEENLIDYTSQLENVAFCNEKAGNTSSSSAKTGTTWGGSGTTDFYYRNYDSNYSSLSCYDIRDRFSSNNQYALLKYPVSLLSQPEYFLLDSETKNVGTEYWLLSPSSFTSGKGVMRYVGTTGNLAAFQLDVSHGVRPSVSLSSHVLYKSGSGSVSDPYEVESFSPDRTSSYLYDAVEQDATELDWGEEYTDDHADTVNSSGNEIVGNEKIYYYKDAGHNNVKLGNFCWQIVRTTDTGGVKLIYNGLYDSTLKCSKSSNDSDIGNTRFSNKAVTTPLNIGYKIKTTNENDTDSTIKTVIDSWYEENMASNSNLLENIVFCDDRTGSQTADDAASGTLWGNYNNASSGFYYHNYKTSYTKLSCPDARDRFSTNNSQATLEYPVGLITAPESLLLDARSRITGKSWWTLSPSYFSSVDGARIKVVERNYVSQSPNSNFLGDHTLSFDEYVRPSVSLVPNIKYSSGNGSAVDPYVIDSVGSFRIKYSAGDHGTLSGTTEEEVESGGNPSGRDVIPNTGFQFAGWVANKDVTLNDNSVITKGTLMTKAQVQNIKVLSLIKLIAKYYKGWLYNQVEDDVTTNGYGSTYTGNHADTVDSDGNPIVGTENIYYYTTSGHNYVKLGDYCWQIIRTTDTGGVKLIYSGKYSDSLKCDVGYLEGEGVATTRIISSGSTYYYGTDYTFDSSTGKYSLSGTPEAYNYSSNGKVGKYTCLSTSSTATCSTLYYIDSKKSGTTWNVIKYVGENVLASIGNSDFNDGINAKKVGYKYKTTDYNDTDSTVKIYIDDWYENNMTSYTSLLEDTVFCNDRTGSTSNGHSAVLNGTTWYGDSSTESIYFHNYYTPSGSSQYYTKLSCDNVKDRFSVNNTEAKLDYPVGLVTQPEGAMAGTGCSNTRQSGYTYWTMSPHRYSNTSSSTAAVLGSVEFDGNVYSSGSNVGDNIFVRPSVSLKPNITFNDGDGSASDPYVVDRIVEPSITATFYYQSSDTSGTQTIASKTASCTPSNGSCSVTIPSEVRSSVGKYNNAYAGLAASTGTMSTTGGASSSATTLTISEDSDYYSLYSSSVNNYYYDSGYKSRTLHRNQWFTSTSAMSDSVLSTTGSGTTNYTTAGGPGSSVFNGLSTAGDGTPEYASIDAAAKSNSSSLYTVYKNNVNYVKGSNVSSIGSTTGSCNLYASGATTGTTSCNVTLPSITPNSGYSSVGWNTTSGATTGTAAGQTYSISANPTTLYANAKRNVFTPTITMTIPSEKSLYKAGDAITYNIVVKNTASFAITNVVVEDPNATIGSGTGYTVSGGKATISSLAAGASVTITASKTLATSNVNTFNNTATITSASASNAELSGTPSASKSVNIQSLIKISKTVEGNMADNTEYFKVKVIINGTSGHKYTISGQSYTGTGKQTTYTVGSDNYIFLKHGETITIGDGASDNKINTGVVYSIQEDANDYETYINGSSSNNKSSGSLTTSTTSNTNTVTIKNVKTQTVTTGIVKTIVPGFMIIILVMIGIIISIIYKNKKAIID